MKKTQAKNVVVLDNIRSTFDALGIDKIILCGTTPTPKDRFGRDREDIAKVSLGAEKTIASEYFTTTLSAVKKPKKEGYKIIMIEQSDKSIDYKKVKLNKKD